MSVLRLVDVAVLLLVLLACGHAADTSGADRPAGGAGAAHSMRSQSGVQQDAEHQVDSPAPAHRDLTRLRGLSPAAGIALLAVALIPLFAGWRFLRPVLGVLLGLFVALCAWKYGIPLFGALSAEPDTVRILRFAGTALGFVLGFALGWVLYQVQLAIAGALLGAMVFSLPGMSVDWPLLTIGLMAMGAAIGFILGWVAAPFWAALQTSILGSFLVVQGTAIICQSASDETMRTLAYAVGVSLGVFGFLYQCIWIARQRKVSSPSKD
ncbi:MAG: hypothetical protein H0V44_01130 [Planctomycetes bacterium]|nr:hypothetical protein [Planctomycetota bacterium]